MHPPPNKPAGNSRPLIRASELAAYNFCERAWWLEQVKKITPGDRSQLVKGRRIHARHARQVAQAARWQRVSLMLLGLGVLLLVVALWLAAG